jgi:hypothetical protein
MFLHPFAFFQWRLEQEERATKLRRRREREKQRRNQGKRVFLFAMLAMKLEEEEKKTFCNYLTMEAVWRRDRRIPRIALLSPDESPWQRLYSSGNDQAMITVTGFDHQAFRELLVFFEPYFYSYTPWTGNNDGSTFEKIKKLPNKRTGRPRLASPSACLGLALAWYRFKGAEFILCGWFGFTGTHANVWLKFTRRMLLKGMLTSDVSRVKMPTPAKIAELKTAVQERHPSLKDVYCVADGLKLYFESCEGLGEQSMYYNGW